MDQIAAARDRLEQASGLPAILDAAYDAFEGMLPVIEELQDTGGGGFAAFMMSGASAASGRDAVAAAPSLRPASPAGAVRAAPALLAAGTTVRDPVAGLAALSRLLAGRLAEASVLASGAGDRAACAQASRHAADVCSMLGGAPGR